MIINLPLPENDDNIPESDGNDDRWLDSKTESELFSESGSGLSQTWFSLAEGFETSIEFSVSISTSVFSSGGSVFLGSSSGLASFSTWVWFSDSFSSFSNSVIEEGEDVSSFVCSLLPESSLRIYIYKRIKNISHCPIDLFMKKCDHGARWYIFETLHQSETTQREQSLPILPCLVKWVRLPYGHLVRFPHGVV